MKSVLLSTVVASFLVGMAYAKPPALGPSISDLAGVWVKEGCVKDLHKEFSVLPYYQLIIEASEDDKTFKLNYNNNTEGISYQLLGLDRTEKAGEYAFRVRGDVTFPKEQDPRPKAGQFFPVRVLLSFDDMGQVTGITLLDDRFGLSIPEDRFVRIPVRWAQYINRVIFAGKWKDERGGVFSFDESGKAHGPDGASFTYKVLLQHGGHTVRFYCVPMFIPPCEDYRYRRIGKELRLSRAPFLAGGGRTYPPLVAKRRGKAPRATLILKKE